MAKFFFTYSTEGQPYYGGWTEVEAPNEAAACEVFRIFHPDKNGFLHCAGVYSEANFMKSGMHLRGNYGIRCHEQLTLIRKEVSR